MCFRLPHKLTQRTIDAKTWKALSLLRLNLFKEALEISEQVLQINPENVASLNVKGIGSSPSWKINRIARQLLTQH